MATFYLPSSGGYNTSNEFIKYRIVIEEGTLNGRVRPVTIKVQFYRTNSGYTTTRNGVCYCTIDGTKYSQSFSSTSDYAISYNSYTTLFSKTVNITYNEDGTRKLPVSAYWKCEEASSGGEGYTSSNQGGSVTLTKIDAVANCYVKDSGKYKAAMLYVKQNGTYQRASLLVKNSGTYKTCGL